MRLDIDDIRALTAMFSDESLLLAQHHLRMASGLMSQWELSWDEMRSRLGETGNEEAERQLYGHLIARREPVEDWMETCAAWMILNPWDSPLNRARQSFIDALR